MNHITIVPENARRKSIENSPMISLISVLEYMFTGA